MGWNDGDYKWEDQANMNSGDSNTNQVNGDDYNLKKN